MTEGLSPQVTPDTIQPTADAPKVNNESPVNFWERKIPRRTALKLGLALGASALLPGCGTIQKPPEIQKTPTEEVPPLPEYESPNPNQKALVIPLLSEGDTEPTTRDHLVQLTKKINTFYEGSSGGKIHYSFDVLDWQTVNQSIDQHDLTKMLEGIATAGDNVAANAHVQDISQYQTRIYLMKANIVTFGGSGRGEKREPATYNRVWIDNFDYTLNAPGLWEHELGHTLGLNHDDFLGFDMNALPDDYQDHVEIQSAGGDSLMGGETGDLNVCQKIALGWINREQVQTVTPQTMAKDGIYTLSALELNSPNSTLALRIPFKQYNPTTKHDQSKFYYVQYNKPVYDALVPSSLDSGGLEFRIWDEGVGSDTEQLYIDHADPHNANRPTPTPQVVDGAYLYDRVHGVKIKQLHHSDNNVSVQVLFDKK